MQITNFQRILRENILKSFGTSECLPMKSQLFHQCAGPRVSAECRRTVGECRRECRRSVGGCRRNPCVFCVFFVWRLSFSVFCLCFCVCPPWSGRRLSASVGEVSAAPGALGGPAVCQHARCRQSVGGIWFFPCALVGLILKHFFQHVCWS